MKSILLEIYWSVTRAYLRLRGAEVGRAVRCNGFPFVRVRKGGRLIIEDRVQVNATPRGNAHVIRGSMALFVGEGATLSIGAGSGLSGARIVAMKSITIGEECMIGGGCLICDSDMHEVPLRSAFSVQEKAIKIGDRVFVGAQSIVLKGVELNDGVVIGAGSVVTRSIRTDQIAAGNPARCLE